MNQHEQNKKTKSETSTTEAEDGHKKTRSEEEAGRPVFRVICRPRGRTENGRCGSPRCCEAVNEVSEGRRVVIGRECVEVNDARTVLACADDLREDRLFGDRDR